MKREGPYLSIALQLPIVVEVGLLVMMLSATVPPVMKVAVCALPLLAMWLQLGVGARITDDAVVYRRLRFAKEITVPFAEVKSLELVKRFWNEQVSVVRIVRHCGRDVFVNAIAVAGKRYHFDWRVRGDEPFGPMLCKLVESTGHEVIAH